jgi:RHS repeat-associated protein
MASPISPPIAAPTGFSPLGSSLLSVRPQTRYSYTGYTAPSGTGTIYRLTGTSACATTSACTGTADETKTTIANGTNLLPSTITRAAGNGAVSTSSTLTWSPSGDPYTAVGPLGSVQTTRYRYGAGHQLLGVVGPDPDGSGPLKYRALRATYDDAGRLTLAERGTVPTQSDSDWANFSSLVAQATTFDSVGRRASDTLSSGGATYSMTQYAYDSANRLVCTAVRMDTAAFGSAPSACQLGTTGVYGPDRITYDNYDNANQLTTVTSALGTANQRNDAVTQYGADGEVIAQTDGKGNLTTFVYDGLLRLSKIELPTPSNGGVSSTTDYEQYGYDANGNMTTDRRRDGQTINYGYDADNDLISGASGVSYGYDALGRVTLASVNGTTSSFSFGYDALSRLVSQTGPLGTVTSQFDALGHKTRLTWPDGFYVSYVYDTVGEATSITESAGYLTTSYSYDDLGRPTSIGRSDQVSTAFGYGTDQCLAALNHYFPNTGYNEYYTFTDNPSGQLQSFTSSNASYNFASNVSAARGYSSDGQNRYTVVGGLGFGYDGRGNLSSYGVTSYGYDVLNRLTNLSSGATLTYDTVGRLYQTTGASTTRFLYDGTQIIGEYDGSGNLLRRYAPGPPQEPVAVWYEGTGTTDRRRLLADRLGSTIAVASEAGALLAIDTYDALGVAGSNNIGRFQFAGMPWLPDEGLYHAQARAYSPALGRFMQSDPIGYGDGLNFYNYVHGDPVNRVDPAGLDDNNVNPDPIYVDPPSVDQPFTSVDSLGTILAGGPGIAGITVTGRRPPHVNPNTVVGIPFAGSGPGVGINKPQGIQEVVVTAKRPTPSQVITPQAIPLTLFGPPDFIPTPIAGPPPANDNFPLSRNHICTTASYQCLGNANPACRFGKLVKPCRQLLRHHWRTRRSENSSRERT